MQAYIVNLESAVARRASIVQRLRALSIPFEICPAIDGRRMGAAEQALVYNASRAARLYRPMTPGEIACALSHLSVYERFLKTEEPWALVLEDDAALAADLPEVLTLLNRQFQSDQADVILLSHVEKFTRWGTQPISPTYSLVRPYKHWWRGHGYLINRAAAQVLLAQLKPVWTAADSWKTFAGAGWVRLHAIVPYCVGLSELAEGSSLETERAPLDDHDKLQQRTLSWYLKRYGYERFLYQLFIRPFRRVVKQKMTW